MEEPGAVTNTASSSYSAARAASLAALKAFWQSSWSWAGWLAGNGPPWKKRVLIIPSRTMGESNLLTVGLAQMAPCWLDRARTLEKVAAWVERAADAGCGLVAFGEALIPGYPFWVELTDGARFNSPLQKAIFAEYAEQAVQPEAGHLDAVCGAAARRKIAVYLGCIERAV